MEENQTTTESTTARKTIIKNFILTSISIMFLFTAKHSMDILQSSVHIKGSLGTYALAVSNLCSIFGSLLFTAFLIKRFGPKLVLLVSMLGYVAYIAANFDTSGHSLIPLAALSGLGSAALYAALWTYISTLGSEYSKTTGLQLDVVYAIFYGIFFVFINFSSIWGNLIMFEVLKHKDKVRAVSGEFCGVHFCDENASDKITNFNVPPNFNVLCAIFVSVSILAMVVMIFIDHREPEGLGDGSTIKGLIETGRKLGNPFMLLVLPMTIYSGLQMSFVVSDYTKAYITCEFGVAYVGYVFICFGAVSTVFTAITSLMVKVIGRKAVFVAAALLDLAMYFALLFHDYKGQQGLSLLFVIVGVMGITVGVWQAQVKALYGILFPNCREVAFSVLGTAEALGLALGFFYSSHVCTQVKLTVLLAVLVFSMTCYGIVECLHAKKNSKNVREAAPTTMSIIGKDC